VALSKLAWGEPATAGVLAGGLPGVALPIVENGLGAKLAQAGGL